MTGKLLKFVGISLVFSIFLFACSDKCTDTYLYIESTPIVKSYDEVRSSFEVKPPQEIVKPGKLYVYNHLLFVVEEYKGFHVIDNSFPSAPIRTQFIQLDGCTDLVTKGNYIYANNANDLVTIEIKGNGYELIDRNKDEFRLFPQSSQGVTIGYDVTEKWMTSEQYNCESNNFSLRSQNDVAVDAISGNGSDNRSGSGTGGSTARMAVVGNYIYAVDNSRLLAISLTNPANPNKGVANDIGFRSVIETIFPMGDYLFIGTTTGMEIFNYKLNPEKPVHEGSASHVRSCDPVVVQNDIAYVTTHGGTNCGGNANVLVLYDVKNVKAPRQIVQYDMTFPLGLGIDGNLLFVCEGRHGLKVYDSSDPLAITKNLLTELSNIAPKDVIPLDGILLVTAEDGVYQYDYSNPKELKLLSKLYSL